MRIKQFLNKKLGLRVRVEVIVRVGCDSSELASILEGTKRSRKVKGVHRCRQLKVVH